MQRKTKIKLKCGCYWIGNFLMGKTLWSKITLEELDKITRKEGK